MRSLHVITSTARRGAETFAVQLSEQLRERHNHAADVVALVDAPGDTFDLEVLGAHRRSPLMLRSLRQRAGSVDVVVAHGSSTLEACAIALRGTRSPFVYRTIGDPQYWLNSTAKHRAVSWMMRRAERHVVLWARAGDDLVRLHDIDPALIHVIPNAVDGRRFPPASAADRQHARSQLGIDADAQVIAVVGALSPEKNPDAVLETARRLPGVTVLVAGDGTSRQRFRDAALELGNLNLVGTVENPFPIYAAADLLLLPSLSEGMPGVVIEAGMVGTPTVAAPVGALPSMLEHGKGVLAASTEPAAIAEACALALRRRPAVSTDHWRQYDMSLIVDSWAALLEQSRRTEPRR